MRAQWLETALQAAKKDSTQLGLRQEPTKVKLLRTTQPVDLNACKAQKKSRRKERASRWKKEKMMTVQRIKNLKAELKYEERKERKEKNKKKEGEKDAAAGVEMDTS